MWCRPVPVWCRKSGRGFWRGSAVRALLLKACRPARAGGNLRNSEIKAKGEGDHPACTKRQAQEGRGNPFGCRVRGCGGGPAVPRRTGHGPCHKRSGRSEPATNPPPPHATVNRKGRSRTRNRPCDKLRGLARMRRGAGYWIRKGGADGCGSKASLAGRRLGRVT